MLPAKDDREKTIPFLRQLTEMLQNNEEIISFIPGHQKVLPNETIHGKIVVHDRNRVQSEVLPIYFNHASFASLRRQLSYFSFVRVGKSRQSGVTYTNESVVNLVDILKLKRRTAGSQAGGAVKQAQKRQPKKKAQQENPPQPQQEKVQQEKHQVQDIQLATTSTLADVASAVLSGTLHAAKTNHSLDSNNGAAAGRSSSPVCHTSSTAQSSISQSVYQTSSSSSSAAKGGDKPVSSDKKKKTDEPIASYGKKIKAYKKRGNPKPFITRKERAKFDRLLSINNIVPFIHLPAGHRNAGKRKDESTIETASQKVHQKESKLKELHSNEGAINALNALLALGGC